MATDPYAAYKQPSQYGQQPEPVYNPYSFTSEEHANNSYDTSYTGYRDDSFAPPVAQPPVIEKPATYETTRGSPYATGPPRDKSSRAVRQWRQSEHKNVWTKGSRARCFGRFFCCTLMTFVILLVSIIATLALWVKPPNITFNGVNFVDPSNKVTVANGGFSIPLTLNISVSNPNFFSATFKNISAVATYPGTDISIGGGSMTNVKFPSDETAYIQFPFTVDYSVSSDSNLTVLKDLANKCGVTGTASDITVDYDLTLKIKILALISPSFSETASFECPLTPSEIESLGGGLLGGS